MTAKAASPGVSPAKRSGALPPECRGSGYSFAAAGRDCCHCAEYGDLRDAWLDKQDKRDAQGNLYRFHDLTDHIHTCPACRAVADAMPTVQASHALSHALERSEVAANVVPRAWLGVEGETI